MLTTKKEEMQEPTKKDEIFPLLDSRLIKETSLKKYDIKKKLIL